MSDCGVCLYADGDFARVCHSENVRARKVYKCYECYRPIAVGELHQRTNMLGDDGWDTYRTCLVCAEIRHAFYCEGEMWGEFWSQMENNFPEMTTGCLSRLKTAAAKAYLVQRWNDWKGLTAQVKGGE